MPEPIPNYPILIRRGEQKAGLYIRHSIGGHGLVAEISVSSRTVQSLRTQIGAMRDFPDYDTDPETFELAAEAVVALAAPDLAAAMAALAALPGKTPTLVIIRGLQIADEPVQTPIDGIVRQDDVAPEAVLLVGVMRHLGLVGTAYSTENGGRLLRAVCPVKRFTATASSQGADVDLGSHVDNGHLAILGSDDIHPNPFPVMNSHQFFVTVTPDAANPMRVRLNDDVFARFDPRNPDPAGLPQFGTLFDGVFDLASPPSHGEIIWSRGLPILVTMTDPRFGLAMRLHTSTTRATTPAAAEALQLLKYAIGSTREETIYTRRGDIVGYLNTAATHRREAFTARYDGTDRYYLRLYGSGRDNLTGWTGLLGGGGRVM